MLSTERLHLTMTKELSHNRRPSHLEGIRRLDRRDISNHMVKEHSVAEQLQNAIRRQEDAANFSWMGGPSPTISHLSLPSIVTDDESDNSDDDVCYYASLLTPSQPFFKSRMASFDSFPFPAPFDQPPSHGPPSPPDLLNRKTEISDLNTFGFVPLDTHDVEEAEARRYFGLNSPFKPATPFHSTEMILSSSPFVTFPVSETPFLEINTKNNELMQTVPTWKKKDLACAMPLLPLVPLLPAVTWLKTVFSRDLPTDSTSDTTVTSSIESEPFPLNVDGGQIQINWQVMPLPTESRMEFSPRPPAAIARLTLAQTYSYIEKYFFTEGRRVWSLSEFQEVKIRTDCNDLIHALCYHFRRPWPSIQFVQWWAMVLNRNEKPFHINGVDWVAFALVGADWYRRTHTPGRGEEWFETLWSEMANLAEEIVAHRNRERSILVDTFKCRCLTCLRKFANIVGLVPGGQAFLSRMMNRPEPILDENYPWETTEEARSAFLEKAKAT